MWNDWRDPQTLYDFTHRTVPQRYYSVPLTHYGATALAKTPPQAPEDQADRSPRPRSYFKGGRT